ncbi:cysteine desulfuration protein SufE [Blochmannia endosymbiont of Polyrhachis (Hedomyrma) turneri]|uniref:cysteine desulfuration protein SufE n=1 Tax=Blochmannia endosymbiont of Polyrhachis (Hedomyrma) turneri TaxID=1505596 RepID=UPI00061A5B0F|nr:cysteine desulfuration protein SufE [Blochmannia endosymbiont of Polyrhachis (Hedomyrma) turneri]AKC59932.1 Cysteine desulfuration protein sufE [Blochmannia endosymbiont of Polyrhachis (Hedomyrma) turneri]
MNNIVNLPTQNIVLRNFHNCINWEEKYLYIIELGNYLSSIPQSMKSEKNLIPGCQSKVWFIMKITNIKNGKNIVRFYGDSESAITKGILCIIFIMYQGLTIEEIIYFDPYHFLNQLELTEHLTYSRSQGVRSILQTIYNHARKLSTISH